MLLTALFGINQPAASKWTDKSQDVTGSSNSTRAALKVCACNVYNYDTDSTTVKRHLTSDILKYCIVTLQQKRGTTRFEKQKVDPAKQTPAVQQIQPGRQNLAKRKNQSKAVSVIKPKSQPEKKAILQLMTSPKQGSKGQKVLTVQRSSR